MVMLADTDAGNVVTAAQAGSVWGFRLAPVLLLLIPVLILLQDLAVRIGIYRNCGFGDLIRENFGRPGAYVAAAALIAATGASPAAADLSDARAKAISGSRESSKVRSGVSPPVANRLSSRTASTPSLRPTP